MDRDIHTDALIYRTTVLSEGYRLSEETVERVVDLQKRYNRQGHSIDFVDFLIDDEKEAIRRCEEAEKYLLTVTARHSYEDRL
ncbi:MAG: hypothetical protein IJS24_01500 [Eubacterium sp.]|nr:hypothetical protein [Eubacterium sp.]